MPPLVLVPSAPSLVPPPTSLVPPPTSLGQLSLSPSHPRPCAATPCHPPWPPLCEHPHLPYPPPSRSWSDFSDLESLQQRWGGWGEVDKCLHRSTKWLFGRRDLSAWQTGQQWPNSHSGVGGGPGSSWQGGGGRWVRAEPAVGRGEAAPQPPAPVSFSLGSECDNWCQHGTIPPCAGGN